MPTTSLVLTQIFPASRLQLFDAWTKPELMQRWLSPESDWQRKTTNTLKVGGHYQHDMIEPDGEIYSHTGEYVEIIRPSKIVFTWNSHIVKNTNVTIELKAIDDNTTELTLTHSLFSNDDLKKMHKEGWTGCFENLAKHLTPTVTN